MMFPFLLLGALVSVATAGQEDLIDFNRIIKEVNSANTTWTAGHNFHLQTPRSYFTRRMGVLKRPGSPKLPAKVYGEYSDIPESFDGSKHWKNCPSFTHIRDQGDCGSCWAVAGASALSDRMCVFTNGNKTAELSAEEVTACCTACGDGCDGGDPGEAWEYFHTHGLVTGGDYGSHQGCQPYSLRPCEHHVKGKRPNCDKLHGKTPTCHESTCTNKKYKTPFEKDLYKSGTAVSFSTVQDAQKSIMTEGSIEAAFNVYADFLAYKSGVYQHTTGSFLGSHAVRVVGWGVENGVDYWLVANSWNTDWGDKGWFKIKRGVDECSFESDLVAGDKPSS